MTLTAAQVAAMCDHTLLKPEATPADIAALVAEGLELGVCAICCSPSRLPLTRPGLKASGLKLAAVVGFPSGAHQSSVKAVEAAQAVADGADEIDMVVDLGALKAGDWEGVEADIRAVRQAVPPPTGLKVIIESAALGPAEIVAACQAAEAAGADFVKTSTGFHPAGGATVQAVELMRATVGQRLGVKASGGIRDRATAEAMIAAGANRLGLSSTRAILAQYDPA
ncbi:MAG: deoxyribose-phosphate aldolase [Propionibacteriaceae bacterium]|jgi:deoxyribose-phosphate aldolase|nr:deoxyribose-phosphate aldolase [Propionibacteriaceae bacterium]